MNSRLPKFKFSFPNDNLAENFYNFIIEEIKGIEINIQGNIVTVIGKGSLMFDTNLHSILTTLCEGLEGKEIA